MNSKQTYDHAKDSHVHADVTLSLFRCDTVDVFLVPLANVTQRCGKFHRQNILTE